MACLEWENETAVSEFLLLGIYDNQDYNPIFAVLFLMLYVLSLSGNSFIITATYLNSNLHTPMYFFICNLSIVDLCLTSVTVPKYLINIITRSLSISFLGCFIQMYLFIWMLATETFLLAVMAYDRYVAICKPLHYILLMTEKCCVLLVLVTWILSSLHALLYALMTFHLCFCGPNTISRFFCEQPPVLALSCSDTSFTKVVLRYESSFLAAVHFLCIFSSYAWIISSIFRLRTAVARKKAFFTCSSHLTVITMFYGTGLSAYFPSSLTPVEDNTLSSMMYALIIPVLNPFIYSLRNKEMKATFKISLRRKPCIIPLFYNHHKNGKL